MTMEEYPEPLPVPETPHEVEPVVHTTECDHSYRLDGVAQGSGLTPVTCTKCWGGHMVDLNVFEVLDGMILKRP